MTRCSVLSENSKLKISQFWWMLCDVHSQTIIFTLYLSPVDDVITHFLLALMSWCQIKTKPQRISVHLTAAAVKMLLSLNASSSIRRFLFLNCASDQCCRSLFKLEAANGQTAAQWGQNLFSMILTTRSSDPDPSQYSRTGWRLLVLSAHRTHRLTSWPASPSARNHCHVLLRGQRSRRC